jgi:hypothetical protein
MEEEEDDEKEESVKHHVRSKLLYTKKDDYARSEFQR